MISHFDENVWEKDISIYFHGASFIWKRNPTDQALAPCGRVWCKANEGLKVGCTSKGFKPGTSPRLVKLMVAIS